jgi:hypothetical protein
LNQALESTNADALPALLHSNIPAITSITSKLKQMMQDLKQLAEDCQRFKSGRASLKPKKGRWTWSQERLRRLREDIACERGNLIVVLSALGLRQNQ